MKNYKKHSTINTKHSKYTKHMPGNMLETAKHLRIYAECFINVPTRCDTCLPPEGNHLMGLL